MYDNKNRRAWTQLCKRLPSYWDFNPNPEVESRCSPPGSVLIGKFEKELTKQHLPSGFQFMNDEKGNQVPNKLIEQATSKVVIMLQYLTPLKLAVSQEHRLKVSPPKLIDLQCRLIYLIRIGRQDSLNREPLQKRCSNGLPSLCLPFCSNICLSMLDNGT